MKIYQVLLLMFSMKAALAFWRNLPGTGEATSGPDRIVCPPGPVGPVGAPGSPGLQGYPGVKGERGTPAHSFIKPPPDTECRCPIGPQGRKGEAGDVGREGRPGYSGPLGRTGEKGDQGPPGIPGKPGAPGLPLPRYPPNNPDMFIPVMFNGRIPRVMCQHIRRQAFVPVAAHDWLGWYEKGKSSYLIHNKWLYFSSRFQCPCSVPIPPGPTPSPAELLRLL